MSDSQGMGPIAGGTAQNALVMQPQPPRQYPAPVSFQEMERMATVIAKSRLFGMKTPEEALALMVIAQAEGLHPGIVARDYHIIQGRPTLKADTMLARFQQSGGTVEWTCYSNERVAAIWKHPSSPRPIEMDWTIERAREVKQYDKDSDSYRPITDKDNWRNYPRAMLRARLISEAVRTVYPAVSVGIYTPEEVQDMDQTPLEAQYEVLREDPRPAETKGQPIASQEPPGQQNRQGDKLASDAQIGLIKKVAQENGVQKEALYTQFKINQALTGELLASEVDEVLTWLRAQKIDDSDLLPY